MFLRQLCFTLPFVISFYFWSYLAFYSLHLRLSRSQLEHRSSYFPKTTVSGLSTMNENNLLFIPSKDVQSIIPHIQDLLPLAAGSPHHVQLHPRLYSCLLRLARL